MTKKVSINLRTFEDEEQKDNIFTVPFQSLNFYVGKPAELTVIFPNIGTEALLELATSMCEDYEINVVRDTDQAAVYNDTILVPAGHWQLFSRGEGMATVVVEDVICE